MKVREIMTPDPACCTPDSTLQEVAQMMRENDCGCIPVVNDHAEMKPVGTITDRDITIRTLAANHNPFNMKAAEIMTRDIATVTPRMSLEECFDVMEEREIRRVLVVDEQGKCCGIIAQADVVQSGVNPIRTNKVIREISESAPSPNREVSRGGQNYKSYLSRQALTGANSLLPLLIGLGSGAALMYLFRARPNFAPRREYSGEINSGASESDYLEAASEENFGKYVDAEQEVEKRQHDLKDRLESVRLENNLPLDTGTEPFKRADETTTNEEKIRTANHGNS